MCIRDRKIERAKELLMYGELSLNEIADMLNYSFPKKVVTKWGLGGLSVYGSIENAATFTARKGMNPQYSFSGSQDNTFVAARVFTLGLNLNF